MKDLFTHLKLVPGKLKFIDERTPNGEAIAIPTGLPGSQVHVIGSGEIDLREIKRDILFVPELMPVPGCCGSSRPATSTWRSSWTSTGRRAGS